MSQTLRVKEWWTVTSHCRHLAWRILPRLTYYCSPPPVTLQASEHGSPVGVPAAAAAAGPPPCFCTCSPRRNGGGGGEGITSEGEQGPRDEWPRQGPAEGQPAARCAPPPLSPGLHLRPNLRWGVRDADIRLLPDQPDRGLPALRRAVR